MMNADNKKIGIAIYKALQGFEELTDFSLNKSDTWASKIVDIRTDLSKIENLEANRPICMIMPLKDGDYFIVVVSLINGTRSNDNITAWIYIPNTVNEKDFSKIYNLTKEVKDQISKQNFNKSDIEEKLGEIQYETDIPEWINLESIESCKTTGYYKLNNVEFSLKDVLDVDCLNSPSFRKYEKVFLINDGLSCPEYEEIKLPSPITKSKVIQPLNSLKANGFIPYIGEKKFSNKIRIFVGEKITVVWKNEKDDRYIDITKSVKVSENFEDKLYPNQNDYKLTINKDCVKVVDKDKTDSSIKEYKLLINGKSVDSSYVFSENGFNEANIIVNAEGYEKYEKKHNLKDNKQITIKLEKKLIKYSCTIGGVEFTAKTKDKISNIEGAEVKYNKIKEEYTVSLIKPKLSSNKKLAIAFVIGLVLGFGATATYYFMNKKIAKETGKTINEFPQNADSSESKETIPPQDNSDECAIDYLNNHNEWKKSEMENIPELKGLWDALVGYKSKDILDFENTLKESDKFKQILEKIDAIKDKNEKFSAENETIVFNDYMNSLNKPSTTQQAEDGNSNRNSITGKENKQGNNQQPGQMF